MIEVSHLTKQYGNHLAVDDVSFTVADGQICGLLGPNGAGKSTIMNILTGYLSATSGQVTVAGHPLPEEADAAKACVGYLPEQPPLYLNETPLEYLRFVGEAKGLRGAELTVQIADAVARTGIEPVRNRRISTLSKGYRQRVGIAQALLGRPEVIILDEPTVGLDPIQIIEIRNLVKELGKRHTVIFSSHILSEVQTICDKILIISKGTLTALGTPAELERQLRSAGEIVLTTDAEAEKARALLSALPHITQVEPAESAADGAVTMHLKTDCEDMHAVSRSIFFAFAKEDRALLELSVRKASLEDVFLELTESGQTEESEQYIEEPNETEVDA